MLFRTHMSSAQTVGPWFRTPRGNSGCRLQWCRCCCKCLHHNLCSAYHCNCQTQRQSAESCTAIAWLCWQQHDNSHVGKVSFIHTDKNQALLIFECHRSERLGSKPSEAKANGPMHTSQLRGYNSCILDEHSQPVFSCPSNCLAPNVWFARKSYADALG